MSEITTPSPSEAIEPSVGQILKSAREERELSAEVVAEKLKLTIRQLSAIEADDYAALPGNTFVRGFVRNYARLLGLDAQPLLEKLATMLPQERVQAAMPYVGDATALNSSVFLVRHGAGWPLWVTSILGLVLGVGAVFWYLQQPPAPDMSMVAPVGEIVTVQPSEVASEPDMVEAASETAAAPVVLLTLENTPASAAETALAGVASAPLGVASAPGAVRVVAEFDSWVQVVDADGQVLLSQLMRQGMEQSFSGKAPYRVKIGNAPKTQLFYRGQRVDLAPYTRADVATLELK